MTTSTLKPITSRRKVEAAQKALKDLALTLGANNKLPTVREICRLLQISAVTAETVLAGLEEQCVVVRRPGSGIYVSPRLYEKNVGLVFGRHAFQPGSSPFCAMLVECCQRRAASHSERFSFYLDMPRDEAEMTGPVHSDLLDALNKGRLDGMLLVARHSAMQEAWLREQGIPVVSFSGGKLSPNEPKTVGFDLREMAHRATDQLQKHGCRRIAMISPYDVPTLAPDPSLHINPLQSAPENETRMQAGHRAMKQLLQLERPDGLIVMDDMLSSGAIAAIREAGLVVGKDILVATHANKGSATLEIYADQLILIEVDPDEMVEKMFTMLERMMSGANTEPAAVTVPSRVKIGAQVENGL